MPDKILMSTKEASMYLNISYQALMINIRKGNLKSQKIKGRRFFYQKYLEEFLENKYSRYKKVYEGQQLFNLEKGQLSTHDACEVLGMPRQSLYHLLRYNKIPHIRKGSAYVLKESDVLEYKKICTKEKVRKNKIKEVILKRLIATKESKDVSIRKRGRPRISPSKSTG